MKVLFVSRDYNEQGISLIVAMQGESLKKAGCGVEYFSVKGTGFLGYLKSIFTLRRYLKTHQIHVIHAHYGLCGILACLAKTKEKLVISFMGSDVLGMSKLSRGAFFLNKILLLASRFAARIGADCIIVKTQEMANQLKIPGKLAVVPNGVDLDRFIPGDKNAARLKLNRPVSKSFAIFVSSPSRPEKNYPLAEKAARDAGLELVAVYGRPTEELVLYYHAADLLILTSYYEGSANVIKEAMACNRPIVSTEVGDARWVMGGVEGCYLTTFEAADVTKKIQHALDFSRAHGRTRGRERITELGLNSDIIAGKILKIYERIGKI